MLKEKEREER